MLLTLFIVLCIIAVLMTLGGGFGDRYWRFGSYQPWIGLLIFLVVLWAIFHFLLGAF